MAGKLNTAKPCPRCASTQTIKSGKVKDRQRYHCKMCNYHFTVNKIGKKIDDYYVVKALQLYLQGISYREIERILGISHVTIMKWVKQFFRHCPERNSNIRELKILEIDELCTFMQNKNNLIGHGFIIAPLGAKMLLIIWDTQLLAEE